MLDERLNDKKEQLLEKDLVLEEVTNLANRLRTQARSMPYAVYLASRLRTQVQSSIKYR